jgi:hypothetical protein
MGFDEPCPSPERILLPEWARRDMQGTKGDRVQLRMKFSFFPVSAIYSSYFKTLEFNPITIICKATDYEFFHRLLSVVLYH